MQAQRLIVAIEGCPVEPEQSEMDFAGPTAAARSAASAGGVHLVLTVRNCPQSEADEADSRTGPKHFPQ